MKVLDLAKQNHSVAGVVAFGFFDTIHLGHRKVIGEAIRLAAEKGVPSSVFLFENNIYPLIGIEKYPIYTFSERVSLIEDLGVDQIYYIQADRAFLSMSPEAFIDYLDDHISVTGFSCGSDFTFGANGEGKPADLSAHFGSVYSITDLCFIGDNKVSSDAVKRALEDADLDRAAILLGRSFSVTRTVSQGRRDGAKMGFPTVNFDLGHLPLKRGVYFTTAIVEGVRYPALTNVGAHPTFDDERENVETHILNYQGDLYDREVTVEFNAYHREIARFSRVEDLVKRIASDVEARRNYDQIRTVRNG